MSACAGRGAGVAAAASAASAEVPDNAATAASAASAEAGDMRPDNAAAAASAAAVESDLDAIDFRHVQDVCMRKAPKASSVTIRRVATTAVKLHNMAGRPELDNAGSALAGADLVWLDVPTLAWLSLAASFEGEDETFMAQLHEGSSQQRSGLKHACLMGLNRIGASSAL